MYVRSNYNGYFTTDQTRDVEVCGGVWVGGGGGGGGNVGKVRISIGHYCSIEVGYRIDTVEPLNNGHVGTSHFCPLFGG